METFITIMLKERYDTRDTHVLEQLKLLGFRHKHSLETVGVLVGSIREIYIDDVKNLDAVAWVETPQENVVQPVETPLTK